jgi:hypothetical protein
MSMVIKTQFAGKSPFKKIPDLVDVSTLRITTDKPKTKRQKGKYDEIFDQLQLGKTLSCKSEDTDRLAQALRNYVKGYNLPWRIKSATYYTKTTGRVFVLPKDPE